MPFVNTEQATCRDKDALLELDKMVLLVTLVKLRDALKAQFMRKYGKKNVAPSLAVSLIVNARSISYLSDYEGGHVVEKYDIE